MTIEFPLPVEFIGFSQEELKPLSNPQFYHSQLQVNESCLLLNIFNIASYHVQNGNQIHIHPHKDAKESEVNLFLNGSVLGAILHQRGILPFHGSSFEYKGKGFLICGDSGAGKSSVVAGFCQQDGLLINDDVTPVNITKEAIRIIRVKTTIKLWSDTLQKLKIENNGFKKIRPSLNKYYVSMPNVSVNEQTLHHIFILRIHEKDEIKVSKLNGLEKFNELRRMIYQRIFLKGMPETEKNYFRQLTQLSARVQVTLVSRPKICDIQDVMHSILKEID